MGLKIVILKIKSKVTIKVAAYPVQESSGKLMTSWCSSGRYAVALKYVDESTLVLVQLVILPTDAANLERVSEQLPSFLRIGIDLINTILR